MIDIDELRERFEGTVGGELVRELVRIEVIDRALALASKLFVAIIPLSIILKAVVPGSGSFGQDFVVRLGLTGLGAEATRTLFASGGEVRGAISVIGVVILLYSVLSFTRGLQRMYVNVWRLHPETSKRSPGRSRGSSASSCTRRCSRRFTISSTAPTSASSTGSR